MNDHSDFFVAGGTLRTHVASYVTRPADGDLLLHLQAGQFCYVLTPRQMGKSSLMVRTAQRLRADGTRVAIIDLTQIGGSSSNVTADQWYLGLLSRLRADLRLPTDVQEWWQAHAAIGVSQRFMTFLHDVVLAQ
ncbi:MAG: AAA-like domain-containing protein, partial [Caldilineaceae bacterium]